MTWGHSSVQTVNIVSNNYSRYGTSIYDQLYDRRPKTPSPPPPVYHYRPARIVSETPLPAPAAPVVSNTSTDSNASGDSGTGTGRRGKLRSTYKSLLTSSSRKLKHTLRGDSSSDTFSIFSGHSRRSKGKGKRKTKNAQATPAPQLFPVEFPAEYLGIQALPAELLGRVLGELPPRDVVSAARVCRHFCAAARPVLYAAPVLTSSYRAAQLVTALRLRPENGRLVRALDLSGLRSGAVPVGGEAPSGDTAPDNAPDTDTETDTETREGSPTQYYEDVAYASWRDWRHRNDPQYSTPALNSYNVKRAGSRRSSRTSSRAGSRPSSRAASRHTSRHSSRHSSRARSASVVSGENSVLATASAASATPRNRQRSGSSVSSITSSIMSSLHGSHLSLQSTAESAQDSGGASPKTAEKGSPSPPQSKWYSLKLRARGRRATVGAQTAPTKTSQVKTVQVKSSAPADTAADAAVPTPHPFTSKFLLKYAACRDLPLGHVLHLLHLCPNLTDINLSGLVLANDFAVKRGGSRNTDTPQPFLLPAVRETEVAPHEERLLPAVYMTDSAKGYEAYASGESTGSALSRPQHARSRSAGALPVLQSGVNVPGGKMLGGGLGGYALGGYAPSGPWLEKVAPEEILARLADLAADRPGQLRSVQLDGSVWCTQAHVARFAFAQYLSAAAPPPLSLSFLKCGMNRHNAWSCRGSLRDVVAVLVLADMLRRDDFQLEQLFGVRKVRQLHSSNVCPSVLEVSGIFPVEHCARPFRLTVVQSTRPTSYTLQHGLSAHNDSLCVRLCVDENSNRVQAANEHLSRDPLKRLDRLAHALVARLRGLRAAELRRTIGENYQGY